MTILIQTKLICWSSSSEWGGIYHVAVIKLVLLQLFPCGWNASFMVLFYTLEAKRISVFPKPPKAKNNPLKVVMICIDQFFAYVSDQMSPKETSWREPLSKQKWVPNQKALANSHWKKRWPKFSFSFLQNGQEGSPPIFLLGKKSLWGEENPFPHQQTQFPRDVYIPKIHETNHLQTCCKRLCNLTLPCTSHAATNWVVGSPGPEAPTHPLPLSKPDAEGPKRIYI